MIDRKEYMNFLIKLKDKQIIKVVTGIRRCGKSTLFELYKNYLLNNGVDREQIISLNFENPNDMKFENWKDLYNYIENKLIVDKMNYIFLDEVQIMNNFEMLVNGLYIKKNVDIYNRFQLIHVIWRISNLFNWKIHASTHDAIIF